MKLKEVCEATGLTRKTIRLYEEKGLLVPQKEARNGREYREYSQEDVEVRMARMEDEMKVEVLDHGIGIPDAAGSGDHPGDIPTIPPMAGGPAADPAAATNGGEGH